MKDIVMVKENRMAFEDLSEVLAYDADSGVFTWKKDVSSRIKTGCRAGTFLRLQNGKDYLSITYRGRKLSAAQTAWLLHYGEWPDRSVFFIDEDTTNLRISNLKLADHKAIRVRQEDGSVKYKMSADQVRHYGLARNYGITLTEYAQMFANQGGVCAICGKPETHKIPGRKRSDGESRPIRDLSVDHCHKTGAVRELLCNACNHVLGAAKDDPEILRKAADYIERHAGDKEQPQGPRPL